MSWLALAAAVRGRTSKDENEREQGPWREMMRGKTVWRENICVIDTIWYGFFIFNKELKINLDERS